MAAADHHKRRDTRQVAIQCISAITLITSDMARSVEFYRILGFTIRYGSKRSAFTSFNAGSSYLNLVARAPTADPGSWGRVIFYVTDVDVFYQHAVDQGLRPTTSPRDAEWGERYFHIVDPDGHELSFAKLLDERAAP